jgi:Phosphoesterase family
VCASSILAGGIQRDYLVVWCCSIVRMEEGFIPHRFANLKKRASDCSNGVATCAREAFGKPPVEVRECFPRDQRGEAQLVATRLNVVKVCLGAAVAVARGLSKQDRVYRDRLNGLHQSFALVIRLYGASAKTVCGKSCRDHAATRIGAGRLPRRRLRPQWDKTLLIITYDEHGGFHNHVPPPPAEDDNPAVFGLYGIRVPAIIVSPLVGRGSVSTTLFDHTSIIKTIFLRFCPAALEKRHGVVAWLDRLIPGRPRYAGERVATANDLSSLLTETTLRPAPPRETLLDQEISRRADVAQGAVRPQPALRPHR